MSETRQLAMAGWKSRTVWGISLAIAGILINLAGEGLANALKLPLYMDTIGTVLVSMLGGYLPGIAVGLATNFLKAFFDTSAVYYGALNVLVAVCTAYFQRRGWLRKLPGILLWILSLSLIGGVVGSVLTGMLYGYASEGITAPFVLRLYETGAMGLVQSQFVADFVIDLADKTVTALLALPICHFLPDWLLEKLRFVGWQQTPLTKEERAAVRRSKCRRISLRTKILLLIVVAMLAITFAATAISYVLYMDYSVDQHTQFGRGVSKLTATLIDADRIDEYLEKGEQAEGYLETEELLYGVRESSPDIEYLYVYRIQEDGCHVVFDLDTDEVKGDEPGDLVPFDDVFLPYLPQLLEGKEIEPMISDESYGWLLTVYQPVYNKDGECVCYAAADVLMEDLRQNGYSFLAKLMSLFLGFFILVLAIGIWFAEYDIIIPVNIMALTASEFAIHSEEAIEDSVERIRRLNIHTGDEIENLYHAFTTMTEDNVKYVEEIQNKTETLREMQNGLIMVLADMVESRDENTGQHVRKTAAYVKIIMEQMRREGIYADQLTDQFIYDVVNSAPLHDVGKIKVPDAILNKPGKLTDEEFAIMKSHAAEGKEILTRAIETVPDSDYLNEARNLAGYHHEKWNGTGYPEGLSGEDIPLSARIMAVADVFDALVSNRSYKKGFPFEKAISIIREGVGSHFDPKVAEAFLHAEDEVRKVAESFGE